jgi:hypothetical protein
MGLTNGICFVCGIDIPKEQYICVKCATAVSQYNKLYEMINELKSLVASMGKSNLIEIDKINKIIKSYDKRRNVGE